MANHRAEKPAASRRRTTESEALTPAPSAHSAPSAGGKRKAVRHKAPARGRKQRIPALPSAPTLVGAAALALAATGAITVSHAQAGSEFTAGRLAKSASQASVLNGATSVGASDAFSDRKRAVSRDSSRQALADAADERLQAEAEAQAKQRNAALAALAASAQKHADVIAKNAWQLPIPAGAYHLTARFGQCSGLWSHCHTGLDFAAPTGTPIHAIAGGVVSEAGWAGAYGNRTIVTLPDGTELWYCHQTSYEVTAGETVTAGQVIGLVGATGNVTGPHLHLEVRVNGTPVDPKAWLVAHDVTP